MVRQVRERLRRHSFRASVDLPGLFVRLGLALVALGISLHPTVSTLIPVWPFALCLVVGLFTRTSTVIVILAAFKALSVALTPINFFLVASVAALARRVRTQGSGPLAIDPLPLREWFPGLPWARWDAFARKVPKARAGYYEQYAAFSLRIPLAFVMLPVAVSFITRGDFPVQLLGWTWLAVGAALGLGFLTPWSGLAAALLFPLAVPLTGSLLWWGLAFGGLALAFVDDDRVSLDRHLRKRGGLFPRLRREVVLEAAPGAGLRPR